MLDDRNGVLVCLVVRDYEDAEQGMEDMSHVAIYRVVLGLTCMQVLQSRTCADSAQSSTSRSCFHSPGTERKRCELIAYSRRLIVLRAESPVPKPTRAEG